MLNSLIPGISLSDRPCRNEEQLREACSGYTSVVVGSDQVWNPELTDNDQAFLLGFVPENIKRISYAASFGLDDLPLQYHSDFKNHLEKFDHLSVRETAGKRIINSLISRDVEVVLDPTLLLDAKKWDLIANSSPVVPHPYILAFSVRGYDSNVMKIACDLKRKFNLPVIGAGRGVTEFFDRTVEKNINRGPGTFLQLIKGAAFVVTNSYHGTIFAINYQRPFLTLPTNQNMVSRMKNILNLLEFNDRLVENPESLPDSLRELDFEKASMILAQQREKSIQYLKNALLSGEVR